MQKWLDRLAPLAERAAAELTTIPPHKLLMRTGCQRDPGGDYRLGLLGREFRISQTTFTVIRADTGEEPSSFTKSLVLTYMVTADGTTPSDRWVGFRELPNGMFYVQAFQGYSGARLVRELAQAGLGLVTAVRAVGPTLAGEPLGIGDAGYAFRVLPRVKMALACWEGDEEFPSQATVLFEDTAAHYLPTDGLAILGSQLVDRVLHSALRPKQSRDRAQDRS
jgi:hypothetical protein